jgi:hypothetical protein
MMMVDMVLVVLVVKVVIAVMVLLTMAMKVMGTVQKVQYSAPLKGKLQHGVGRRS